MAKTIDRCQCCGSERMHPFYEVSGLPVHSTLLMPSPEAALAYPRGDVRLGLCKACGFIQNLLFDPAVHEYSARCEESQGFSPHFHGFLADLGRWLVDRHGVRGKTVLEIGCGKGDFLELVCGLGHNRGIGIDPGVVPERRKGAAASLELVQDFYGPRHAEIAADVIVCRHTLEHIQPVHAFLSMVRRHVGDRRDALVFFEVPDVGRVLEEAAFWDIYYEHCSYFTPGSLSRLFHSVGFEITDLRLGFSDQYVLLAARPSAPALPNVESEEDRERIEHRVGHFERASEAARETWRRRLDAFSAEGQRVAVWGSSSKGVAFLTTLGVRDEVGLVVDVNPYRQGKFMPGTGHLIVAPEEMRHYRPDVVIVMNPVYTAEIDAALRAVGVTAQIVTP